jgi:hypothetical protein
MADGLIRLDLDTIGLPKIDGRVERIESSNRDSRFPTLERGKLSSSWAALQYQERRT